MNKALIATHISAAFAYASAMLITAYASMPTAALPEAEVTTFTKGPQTPMVEITDKPKPAPVFKKTQTLFINTSSKTQSSAAYLEFCEEFQGECGGQKGATAVAYSDELMQLLSNINLGVNKSITYNSDQKLYGVNNKFALPAYEERMPLRGDCEDYALLKRKLLKQYIPMEAMMWSLVKYEGGGDHAVLVVRTTRGDYVLDNRHQEVKLARETEYSFNYLSRPENDYFLSPGVVRDESNDTALLNIYNARPVKVKADILPTVEDIQLALAPPVRTDSPVRLAQVGESPTPLTP